jgi:MFS family permease
VTRAERLLALAVASFRAHFAVFLGAAVVILLLAAVTGWRWIYWVAMVWGGLLLLHYLIYKTRTVDDRWVEERTEELHLKSYDRDHIDTIRSRLAGEDTPGSDPARR